MMNRTKTIGLFFLLLGGISFLQAQNAFGDGEKLVFSASYNMSGLMTELAQVEMEVKKVRTSKSTLLHLKCKARTYEQWDRFFNIRDLYEAYLSDDTYKPVMYKRDIQEGNYAKQEKYIYDYKNRVVRATMTKKDIENKKEVPMDKETMDVVSTIYSLRNMDIAQAKVGDSKVFTVLFDAKELPVTLTYLGKESINVTGMGKVACYKLSVGTSDKLLKDQHKNTIWLTADSNKVPVLIKFKIPVGSGQLALKSVSGLQN